MGTGEKKVDSSLSLVNIWMTLTSTSEPQCSHDILGLTLGTSQG